MHVGSGPVSVFVELPLKTVPPEKGHVRPAGDVEGSRERCRQICVVPRIIAAICDSSTPN